MFAEIYNKVPEEWRRKEDVLTSSFFGLMRYTSSFKSVLGFLMSTAKFQDTEQQLKYGKVLEAINQDWKLCFWEQLKMKEIDVVLLSQDSKTVIGIEVKYLSGLSSEDKSEVDLEKEESKNQLAVYAKLLREKYKGYQCYLIFLAKATDAKYLYDASVEKVLKGQIDGFGYCSWESFFRKLQELELTMHPDKLIVKDLKHYLSHKGLDGFTSFNFNEFKKVKINLKIKYSFKDSSSFFKGKILQDTKINPELLYQFEKWN